MFLSSLASSLTRRTRVLHTLLAAGIYKYIYIHYDIKNLNIHISGGGAARKSTALPRSKGAFPLGGGGSVRWEWPLRRLKFVRESLVSTHRQGGSSNSLFRRTLEIQWRWDITPSSLRIQSGVNKVGRALGLKWV